MMHAFPQNKQTATSIYWPESLAQKSKKLLGEVAKPSFDVVLGTVLYWLAFDNYPNFSVYKAWTPCCKPSKNISFWDEQWKKNETLGFRWGIAGCREHLYALLEGEKKKKDPFLECLLYTSLLGKAWCVFSLSLIAALSSCSLACLC